jgi:sortase A
MRSRTAVLVMGILFAALLGCSGTVATGVWNSGATRGPEPSGPASGGPPAGGPTAGGPSPGAPAPPSAATRPSRGPVPPVTGHKTGTARLTIASIGIERLRVVPYEGTTDDRRGTRIQDRGTAASPYGPRGGVGPGETGNYLVTGHRLSAGGPFRRIPSVKKGDKVMVTEGRTTYTYTITGTRRTDFRSPRSLAEQRAAVPGFPGRTPTRAVITISTCATLEDNAAGNYWRDEFDNPQHRIDKVGVLTARSKAPAGGD